MSENPQQYATSQAVPAPARSRASRSAGLILTGIILSIVGNLIFALDTYRNLIAAVTAFGSPDLSMAGMVIGALIMVVGVIVTIVGIYRAAANLDYLTQREKDRQFGTSHADH